MKNLFIEGTKHFPTILFEREGTFRMLGRGIPDNSNNEFEPIYNWLNDFSNNKVDFHISMDYMNTSYSKHLFDLLKLLDKKKNVTEVTVNWFYESDDEDHYETGQIFSEGLKKVKFHFHEFADEEL